MVDSEIQKLQRFKESHDRQCARQSAKKRQNGLLKKAEQFRRVTGMDVALVLFDPASGQYCVYRSRDDESWPPSIIDIVCIPLLYAGDPNPLINLEENSGNSINYLPKDFIEEEGTRHDDPHSADETVSGGKKRRRKIPNIILERKKAKVNQIRRELVENHPDTEQPPQSHITPESSVAELDNEFNSANSPQESEPSGLETNLQPTQNQVNTQQPPGSSSLASASPTEEWGDCIRDILSIPDDDLNLFALPSPPPNSYAQSSSSTISIARDLTPPIPRQTESAEYEQRSNTLSSIQQPRILGLPLFLRSRFLMDKPSTKPDMQLLRLTGSSRQARKLR